MIEKIENCLIAAYRKLRERPAMGHAEFIGIFINYINREFSTHGRFNTNSFFVNQTRDSLREIRKKKEYMFTSDSDELSETLRVVLDNLTWSDNYALYLRSSFEDPIQDPDGSDIIRKSFINH